MLYPISDHIPMIATEYIPNLGSVSQPIRMLKRLLINPNSVLSSHRQIIAIAAGATTMGRKKMVR